MSGFVTAATTLARVQVGGLTSGLGTIIPNMPSAGYVAPPINFGISANECKTLSDALNKPKQSIFAMTAPTKEETCGELVISAAILGAGAGCNASMGIANNVCPPPAPPAIPVLATSACKLAVCGLAGIGTGFAAGLAAHAACK